MGTNYFLVKKVEDDAINAKFGVESSTWIHIGKNSAGWRFIFRGYDEVTTYGDWRYAIAEAMTLGWTIQNEYGTQFNFEHFFELVEETKHRKVETYGYDRVDPEGWLFTFCEFF